jgi:hypothetical protein
MMAMDRLSISWGEITGELGIEDLRSLSCVELVYAKCELKL